MDCTVYTGHPIQAILQHWLECGRPTSQGWT